MEWFIGGLQINWLDLMFGVWLGILIRETFDARHDGKPLGVGTISGMLPSIYLRVKKK